MSIVRKKPRRKSKKLTKVKKNPISDWFGKKEKPKPKPIFAPVPGGYTKQLLARGRLEQQTGMTAAAASNVNVIKSYVREIIKAGAQAQELLKFYQLEDEIPNQADIAEKLYFTARQLVQINFELFSDIKQKTEGKK